jgi:hypothetical protein
MYAPLIQSGPRASASSILSDPHPIIDHALAMERLRSSRWLASLRLITLSAFCLLFLGFKLFTPGQGTGKALRGDTAVGPRREDIIYVIGRSQRRRTLRATRRGSFKLARRRVASERAADRLLPVGAMDERMKLLRRRALHVRSRPPFTVHISDRPHLPSC